jgi:cysteinyl-tRNA synthetase
VADLVATSTAESSAGRSHGRCRPGAEVLRDIDQVLAILPEEIAPGSDVATLLEARAAARAERDFAASDRLRDELAGLGVIVEDTRDGQRWRRVVEAGRG